MQQIAKEIRKLTVECIASLGQGHIGGSLSIVDVLTVLYFKQMNVDVNNPKMEGRDRLVVSKGHAGPAVYATLCRKGYISHDELLTLNKFGTNLPSHCDMNKTPGVDMTTGSLGQGISCAVGMALANKLDKNDKALDDDRVAFYKMILDFDNISSKDKIKLFNEFKDRNFSLTFYDDLRKLKDASYDMIKNDLLDLSKYSDKVSSIDCERTQCLVYDLRDSKYTMLVRSKFPHKDKSNKRRNCYSIISDENNNTFDQGEDNDKIIYGYNSFLNDRVIHMLEQDAFSSDAYNDNKDVSNYVNRIVSKDELVLGSDCYSEVELVNMQDKNGKYINQKPDFIVVYDNIRDIDIIESKRLNIPIVIIRKNILDKNERIDMEFDREKDRYVNSSSDEVVSRKFR